MTLGGDAIGLVVNPVAGVGGAAGLKGSDGAAVQALARSRGGVERARERTVSALHRLPAGTSVLTAAGAMGADACAAVPGLRYEVCYTPGSPSGPEDTVRTVQALLARGVRLILFSGGDGTARDVLRGLASASPLVELVETAGLDKLDQRPAGTPVLGIPCGVKMYSGVFAVSPAAAGAVASAVVSGSELSIERRDVVDVSEEQIRAGIVEATRFGSAPTPVVRGRTQSRKSATAASEADAVRGVAAGLAAKLQPRHCYFLGPGSTMAALASLLGVATTPLGVDVVRDGELLLADASAPDLLRFADESPCHAVITSIGGQGFLLGRGNQQYSTEVLRRLAEPKLLIGATTAKLLGVGGPLLIDTGDPELDAELAGHLRVTTGAQDTALVRAVAASADQSAPATHQQPSTQQPINQQSTDQRGRS
ncbi:MAG: NAD(+)/NADH kinase [Micropruina sp.]|uniref:ATP-NAD kinase family protein n=1 Tax=Micropruina sp. TaxID=2737536 RepID=UPI0039E3396F